jgi:hypothetical protein
MSSTDLGLAAWWKRDISDPMVVGCERGNNVVDPLFIKLVTYRWMGGDNRGRVNRFVEVAG